MLAWIFDECREGQIPRCFAVGYLILNEFSGGLTIETGYAIMHISVSRFSRKIQS